MAYTPIDKRTTETPSVSGGYTPVANRSSQPTSPAGKLTTGLANLLSGATKTQKTTPSTSFVPSSTKTSTPAVSTSGGTVDALKWLFSQGSIKPKPIGFSQEEYEKLPPLPGPRIVTGPATAIYETVKFTAEAVPKFAIETFDALRRGIAQAKDIPVKDLDLGFDLTRLDMAGSKAGETTLPSLWDRTLRRQEELDVERPTTPNLNTLQAFAEGPLDTIFSGFTALDVGKVGIKSLLEYSKSSPMLGLQAGQFREMTGKEVASVVTRRFSDKAKEIVTANTKNGVLSNYGKKQLSQLSLETQRLANGFNTGEIPKMNKFGDFLDSMAVRLSEDVAEVGKRTLTPGVSRMVPGEETLPGYVPEGSTINVGLRTQPVKPVGFGKNVDYDKAKEMIKNSEALDIEKSIKTGDIKRSAVYKTGDVLTPEFADGRIDDVAQKLDMFQKGLGDKLRAQVDVNNVTMKELTSKGLALLDEAKTPQNVPAYQKGVAQEMANFHGVKNIGNIDDETYLFINDWKNVDAPTIDPESLATKPPSQNVIERLSKYRPDKPITLYRGVREDQMMTTATGYESWTKSKLTAKGFAGAGGKIITREFKPEEVLVDFDKLPKWTEDINGNVEKEVIVKGQPLPEESLSVAETAGDLTEVEAKNEIKKLFSEEEIKLILDPDIGEFAGVKLAGKYTPARNPILSDLIEVVSNNGMVSSQTLYHESFHAYLNRFTTPEVKAKAIDYVKKEILTAPARSMYNKEVYQTPEKVAEEWLADDFARWVADKKTSQSTSTKQGNWFTSLFTRMVNQIRQWIRRKSQVEKIYEQVINRDRTTINKTFRQEVSFKARKKDGLPPLPKVPKPDAKIYEMGLAQKAEKITRPEDVLLRDRIRAEARGAKEVKRIEMRVAKRQVAFEKRQAKREVTETRRITRQELIDAFKSSQKNVHETQQMLLTYIKDNLPLNAQGKFMNAIISNITARKQASIFTRVDQLSEKIDRSKIVSELKSVPKGEIAVDYQKKINELMSGIDLAKPTEKTLRNLNSLKNYIAEHGTPLGISQERIDSLKRLTKKNVSMMTTTELKELRDNLTMLRELGKLKVELKNKYNQRLRDAQIKKTLETTNNLDPNVKRVNGRLSQLGTWQVESKRFYLDTMHTPRVADMIDGYKGYSGHNAKMIKDLMASEAEAKLETQNIVTNAIEEITKLGVTELTQEQQIKIMINIRLREKAFDQVKTLMDTYGLTEVPELSAEENQIIEILKTQTNKYTDRIGAIYEEINNQIFPRLEEYILPIKYERENNIVPNETIEQTRHRTTQTFQGFTVSRQKGVDRLPRVDILGVFEEAINDQQWYMAMQPILENMRYVVKSEEYVEKSGDLVANFWRDYMDVVARRGWSATAKSNPVLRQVRLNLNNAILGYKLSSILMQPFAIFDAMAYTEANYGARASLDIIEEFSKTWINPKYAKEVIAESPALQVRQGGELAIEETKQNLSGQTQSLLGKYVPDVVKAGWKTYIRGGMSLLQKADVTTASGVRQGLKKALLRNGVNPAQADREADFLMNMVSGSAEVTTRPIMLSKGEGSRMWFTFQTFMMNRWGLVAHDLIRSGVINNPDWRKKFTSLVGLGIIIAGVIAEEETRKELYKITSGKKIETSSTLVLASTAIPEMVPFFGNLISSARQFGSSSVDFPVGRVLENLFGGIGVFTKKTPQAKLRAGMRSAEAGVSALLGIPGTTQISDILERIFVGTSNTSTASANGLPALPKLPKLPALPKLPTI